MVKIWQLAQATVRDFLKQQTASKIISKHKLRTNEDYFQLFIQNVKDYAIFLLDTKGHVVSWNEGAKRIKGYSASEIIGKHISEFYPQESKDIQFPQKELLVAKEVGRFEDEGVRVRKDGSQFWANVVITAIYDEQKNHTGYVKITRDITERKKSEENFRKFNENLEKMVEQRTRQLILREEELKEAKNAAETANELKSSFLANMSHEIRTPLGAILGFSEILVNEEVLPDERQNILSSIKRNGKVLSNLINDILDLSKVEAGKLLIEKNPILLTEILKDLRSTLTLEASGRGITLEITEEEGLPNYIETDSLRLRQILLNIIGNAIKFTEKGFVRLTVNRFEGNKIAFIVTDTGYGISKEQSQKLFETFNQADSSITRKFGGTGLGLALSKRLAILLGGDLVLVESQLGQGSTFMVTIASGNTFSEKIAASFLDSENPEKLQKLKDKKILVVDDSQDNQSLVSIILKNSLAKTEVAQNGIDAIQKVASFQPDIILMDLQMPIMGGLEATQELRKSGFAKPIIALSAHAMREEQQRCMQNGFDDYLTKPIDRKNLIETLIQFSTQNR